jgi:methylmalonyl-CoA/ethylmalonyl-CoA epimerase
MLRGNTIVELLEPLPGSESGLTRFLAKRGPGLHHLCIAGSPPLENKLAQLKDAGLALLDEAPRVGAEGKVFFVHPRSAEGVLIEYVEKGPHTINY